MVHLWWVFAATLSACEFDCHSNLCGDNSMVPIVNYTFYGWEQGDFPEGPTGTDYWETASLVRTPWVLPTLNLTGRGITSIAVGGFDCSTNWTASEGANMQRKRRFVIRL
jgi:hypothetical protein